MKRFFLLVMAISVVFVFGGCETMKGFAKDIQNTGDNIWEAVTRK